MNKIFSTIKNICSTLPLGRAGIGSLLAVMCLSSCDMDVFNVGADPSEGTSYKVSEGSPIADVLLSDSRFTEYVSVLQNSKMFSALNQSTEGVSFTALVPTNDAMAEFESRIGKKMSEMPQAYCRDFVMYHTVKDSILPDAFIQKSSITNLSNDKLTIIIDSVNAGQVILKNNNSTGQVSEMGLAASNGRIYVLSKALTPLTETIYNRLEQDADYSLMLAAINEAGWTKKLNSTADTLVVDGKTEIITTNYTLLGVKNAVFAAAGINSVADLKQKLQADDKEGLTVDSLLKAYVGYHILLSKNTMKAIGTLQGTSTSRLWSTAAKNQIFNITIDADRDSLVIINEKGTSARFDKEGSNVLALNGYVHSLDSYLPVWEPEQQEVLWDLAEDNLIKNVVEKAEVEYQPKEKPTKKSQVGLGSIASIAITETESANNNFTTLTYYVPVPPNDMAVKNGAKIANNYDCLVFNVGNTGTVSMTTPTIVRGKYRVEIDMVYATEHNQIRTKKEGSGGTLEINFDGENTKFVAPYTQITSSLPQPLPGTYSATLYDEIEFEATESHTFFFKVKDGAASTYKNFSLQFDAIRFIPIK